MNGLVSCFEKLEESLGIHTHAQIIIFTDYNELSPDEMFFKIRPPFPVKLHIFSMAKTHHVIKSSGTSVKEESTLHTNQKSSDPSNLKQLTKLYGGHCYFLTCGALDDFIISDFIKKHYDKYSGYLVFGHLISPIELNPDPNLVMWLFERQNQGFHPSLSSATDSGERTSHHIPQILNIVGFIPGTELSSPKCISKHTILPLNVDETELAYGVRISRRDRETLYGKHKKIVKADACKTDEPLATFYQLLHQTLSKSRTLSIPPPPVTSTDGSEEQQPQNPEAKRICAIVSLGGVPERFAYVTCCNDGDYSSSLVLGILNESLEISLGEEYCKNIPKSQLASNNLAYPWLQKGVGQMVDQMAIANTFDIPPTGEQFDLFSKSINMKTYNYDFKQTKNVTIPFQKTETLSNDMSKIQRNIKNLPKKTELITNECEKLRYIAQVFHNPSVIETLKVFFTQIQNENLEKVNMESSTETQEQLLRANRVLKIIIEQLEKNPKTKLKAPKGEQYFEGISQELATIKHQQHEQQRIQQLQHQQQYMVIESGTAPQFSTYPQQMSYLPTQATVPPPNPYVMPNYPVHYAPPQVYDQHYPLPQSIPQDPSIHPPHKKQKQ